MSGQEQSALALATPLADLTKSQVRDEDMAFQRWLQQGIDAGWTSRPYCSTHDVPPFTDHELKQEGDEDFDLMDMCTSSVRLLFGVK